MKKLMTILFATAVAVFAAGTASAQATLTLLDTVDLNASIKSLSNDGSIGYGIDGGAIFRWEASLGSAVEYLPDTVPGGSNEVFSVNTSEDGTHVISNQPDPDTGFWGAAVWNATDGWNLLHGLPGGAVIDNAESTGWDLNGDGSVAVGMSWMPGATGEAFRWSEATGIVALGAPTGRSSRATAVSADGSTVVGFWQAQTGSRLAARWVDDNPVDLILGGDDESDALDVSGDGTYIVGTLWLEGFIYDDSNGHRDLGKLDFAGAGEEVVPTSVSDDGSRVAGWDGNVFLGWVRGFLWTPEDGIRAFDDVLTENGIDLGDWGVLFVWEMSGDGTTFAGEVMNSVTFERRGFVATVPIGRIFADGFETGDMSKWSTPVR